jgi:2-oxoglutarate ferredoxin oxidoreductase subunit delta
MAENHVAADEQDPQRAIVHVRIEINRAWCKGCQICVSFCPRQVLDIDRMQWTAGFHPIQVRQIERCIVCRTCELLCPDLAIEVTSLQGHED